MSQTVTRYFMYVLAGPLANLGSALVVLKLALQNTATGGIAKWFVIGSALVGLGNLIPFKRKNLHSSDGKKLIALVFNPGERNTLLFRLTLLERIRELRNLREMGQVQLALDKAEALAEESERIPELMSSADYRQRLTDLQELLTEAARSKETVN